MSTDSQSGQARPQPEKPDPQRTPFPSQPEPHPGEPGPGEIPTDLQPAPPAYEPEPAPPDAKMLPETGCHG
jgi:hypothetical protein